MAKVRDLIIRISVSENTDRGVRRVTTSLRETNRELDRANKDSNRFSGTLSKLGRTSMSGLVGGLAKVAAVTKTVAIGLLAVGTAAAAMNTAIQAGAALAPLAGLLALLPGLAVGAAAALGTLHLATSGVGDAFKQAMSSKFDPKKFAASLKDLSPAARSVAVELHRLRPELIGIRNSAQQALFAPLRGQLTAIVKVLAGPLRQGVSQVAHQFGLAGVEVGGFLRQAKTVGVLRSAFATVATSVHQLLFAIQPVLMGFRDLARVGLGFLPGLASSVSTVAQRFGAWLQQISASGKAAKWIQNALATLKQLGGILKQVGGILKSVFSAASAAGSGFLGVLGQALAKLNVFLKTKEGKADLTAIFKGLAAIGTALAPVITAVVTQLGKLAKPVANLITMLGPLLTAAIDAIGPALAALGPGLATVFEQFGQVIAILRPELVPVATAFSQVVAAIAPVLPLIARLVATLVDALAPILPIVVRLVAQLAGALAPILGQLVIAAAPLVKAIVQLAGAFVPLIPPIATLIVQLVQGLVPAILPLVPVLTQLAQVVGAFLVQALGILLRALIPLLPTIVNLAKTFVTQLLPVAVQLSPALLNILTALMPLLPALIQLAPPILQIILATDPLIALLLQFAAVILVHVLPPVVKLATFLTTILAGALTFIAKVVTKITSAVVGAFQWLYNKLIGHSIIPDLVNGMIRWFGSLPGRIVGFFANIAKGAANQMTGLIRWLGGVPGAILRALGKTGSILYNAGRNIVIGLWNGVASLWNWLIGKFHSLTNLIPRIKGPPERDRKLLTPAGVAIMRGLGEGITSQIPALTRTLAAVTDQISVGAAMPVTSSGPTTAASTPRGVASAGAARRQTSDRGLDVGMLARAIAQALSGTTVQMDGKPVGEIVSRHQGRVADQRRRTG